MTGPLVFTRIQLAYAGKAHDFTGHEAELRQPTTTSAARAGAAAGPAAAFQTAEQEADEVLRRLALNDSRRPHDSWGWQVTARAENGEEAYEFAFTVNSRQVVSFRDRVAIDLLERAGNANLDVRAIYHFLAHAERVLGEDLTVARARLTSLQPVVREALLPTSTLYQIAARLHTQRRQPNPLRSIGFGGDTEEWTTATNEPEREALPELRRRVQDLHQDHVRVWVTLPDGRRFHTQLDFRERKAVESVRREVVERCEACATNPVYTADQQAIYAGVALFLSSRVCDFKNVPYNPPFQEEWLKPAPCPCGRRTETMHSIMVGASVHVAGPHLPLDGRTGPHGLCWNLEQSYDALSAVPAPLTEAPVPLPDWDLRGFWQATAGVMAASVPRASKGVSR